MENGSCKWSVFYYLPFRRLQAQPQCLLAVIKRKLTSSHDFFIATMRRLKPRQQQKRREIHCLRHIVDTSPSLFAKFDPEKFLRLTIIYAFG